MKKQHETVRHNQNISADIIFGIGLICGLIFNYLWPLSFEKLSDSINLHMIGAPLLILGGFIIILAKKELQRFGESSEHKFPTLTIVKSGLYRYSRNPLYLGLAICFSGLGFALNIPWYLILLFPTLLMTQFYLILPEEKCLENNFGDEYTEYKKTVRRWF